MSKASVAAGSADGHDLSSEAVAQRTVAARNHAEASPASNKPAIAEPTFAERARTLMYLGRVGSLSTVSRKQVGFPYGSVMPYGLDDQGQPSFLISTMAMHTQNLQADPRASLLVTQPGVVEDPLAAPRVTLLGNAVPVPEHEVAGTRGLYLERHANSNNWVDFEDFSFYRLNVVDVYYVGGFGVMGWVSVSDYSSAQPDPLADAAADIVQHMNNDHVDALILLARAFAGMESPQAAMTSVDRLGFTVRLKTGDGTRSARIAFLQEVRNRAEARKVLIEMVEHSRQILSNDTTL